MNTRRSDPRIIFVVGMPRSGTSWLAKALSFDPTFTYYREPDNHVHVAGAQRYFHSLYLTRDRGDEAFDQLIDRAVRGEVSTAFTRKEDVRVLVERMPWLGILRPYLHRLLPRRRSVLLKLIASNLALDRLAARYPDARQVYIVRHPCGVFASRKRLGWTPQPQRLLEDAVLVRDHLEPYQELIASAGTYWEKAGAYWGAINYVVMRQTPPNGPRTILHYEWLCADPVPHFQALYRHLGLEWNKRAEAFLSNRERLDHRPYSLRRYPPNQIAAWQKEVTPEDQAACRQFVEPFGLPYYRDFQPDVDQPAWFTSEAESLTSKGVAVDQAEVHQTTI